MSLSESDFFAQALWLGDLLAYKTSWPSVVFRVSYGRWPEKAIKQVEPQEPSDAFLRWLVAHWRANLSPEHFERTNAAAIARALCYRRGESVALTLSILSSPLVPSRLGLAEAQKKNPAHGGTRG